MKFEVGDIVYYREDTTILYRVQRLQGDDIYYSRSTTELYEIIDIGINGEIYIKTVDVSHSIHAGPYSLNYNRFILDKEYMRNKKINQLIG
jgi:hypothetical protein